MNNGQLTMDNGQLTMDNGQLTMDNGQLTMDNGQWTMDNGHYNALGRPPIIRPCYPTRRGWCRGPAGGWAGWGGARRSWTPGSPGSAPEREKLYFLFVQPGLVWLNLKNKRIFTTVWQKSLDSFYIGTYYINHGSRLLGQTVIKIGDGWFPN